MNENASHALAYAAAATQLAAQAALDALRLTNDPAAWALGDAAYWAARAAAQAARAAAQNHAIGLHGNILQSFNSIYYTIDKGKNTMRGLMSGANRDRLKKRRRAAHTSA